MTIQEFLTMFPCVKPTKKGWDVQCPAHDDHDPSLGIAEGQDGRIMLHCWAGCTPEEICRALGLAMTDLFADQSTTHVPRRMMLPRIPRGSIDFMFELHAFDLRRASNVILSAAKEIDVNQLSDEELNMTLNCVNRAYAYVERAEFCEAYADHRRRMAR